MYDAWPAQFEVIARRLAAAFGAIKRSLARVVGDDREAYYDVKDPVCDLIMAAAELWAANTG